MFDWAASAETRIEFIQPGKPQQNAHVERLYRTVRYEWLGQHHWASLDEVQDHATRWMWSYKHERPNMGLGGNTWSSGWPWLLKTYFWALWNKGEYHLKCHTEKLVRVLAVSGRFLLSRLTPRLLSGHAASARTVAGVARFQNVTDSWSMVRTLFARLARDGATGAVYFLRMPSTWIVSSRWYTQAL